jgi:hypothetical protein
MDSKHQQYLKDNTLRIYSKCAQHLLIHPKVAPALSVELSYVLITLLFSPKQRTVL